MSENTLTSTHILYNFENEFSDETLQLFELFYPSSLVDTTWPVWGKHCTKLISTSSSSRYTANAPSATTYYNGAAL